MVTGLKCITLAFIALITIQITVAGAGAEGSGNAASGAIAEGGARGWKISATGFYPLAFMTLAERQALLDASSARVKAADFLRRNPDDFNINVLEDEPLADTLDRIMAVVANTAIVPEHLIIVIVKSKSVQQLPLSPRKPFAAQLEKLPEAQGLRIGAGDVILLQAYCL